MPLTHAPGVFAVRNLDEARRIILTPTSDASTDERWENETPYLTKLAKSELALTPDHLVIDYGCGVGRIGSSLIRSSSCRVLGIDASAEMRALASASDHSPRFAAVSRGMLEALVTAGFRAEAAVSIWVLQHIPAVEDDIALLKRALAPGGKLLVVNTLRRAIPVEGGWADDGKDIRAVLCARFAEQRQGVLDASAVGQQTAAHAFWGLYKLDDE